MTTVRFPVAARNPCLLCSVQTGCWCNPASYPLGTGGYFPGVKRPGREDNHSAPSIVEVKNGGAIAPFSVGLYFIYLNCKWVLPGGSDTVRHYTQITHITQNNTPHSNKTAHRTTQAIKDTLHKMNTMQIRLYNANMRCMAFMA
jgi:hypothetical protein